MPAQATIRPPIRPQHRPMPHARQPDATHRIVSNRLSWRQTAGLVFEGVAAGAVVLGLLLLIYHFGHASDLFDPRSRFGESSEPVAPPKTTTIYRDMHNGKLLVTEIDGNKTTVKGTIAKEDAPIAGNMYRDPRRMGIDPSSDATDRLNAFSNTFK
jgi:hypothetical protein